MFGKKECTNCGEKINDKCKFCSNCGDFIDKKFKKNNSGMLGENDSTNEFENFSNSIFSGVGGKMIGKMLESAMKMLEKEMQKEIKRKDFQPKVDYKMFINGKRINLNHENSKRIKNERKEIPSSELPQGNWKKFSGLPKKDPSTNVRRFSDKVIYEIYMPGVKSEKDLSIIKLENNIEIKGVSKNKVYKKLIPMNFPITNYNLFKGKLVLELGINEPARI
jgi:HSP20 family molecular chaperone IbpA|tara:strand:+ start:341 stop:1003 length:663 start_codon:yes stop_codon:yes gene_type:complete